MSNGWERGSTRAWRTLRAAVLARDRYHCRAHTDGWCDRAGRTTPHVCEGPGHGTHAHHTRGKAAGDDPRHIVASCPTCNLHIGDPMKAPDPPVVRITNWGKP